MIQKLIVGAGILLLAGCAHQPTAKSHQHVTDDGKHWAIQITMHTGVPNTPQQTVMIVYNTWSKTPIAQVNGQTQALDEKLLDSVVTLVASAGSAAITGNYMLQAAKAECPVGTLCGTLVQVQNSAGATAGAEAQAGI